MATDVLMPRLSDSMEEGTVLKWLVEQGGAVKRGAPLVEIETDKANMTYEADTDGFLIELLAQEGDTLEVGQPIANKEFLLKAFTRLGEHRREALRIAAGFRGDDAFEAGVSEEQALDTVLPWLSRERTMELAAEAVELYCWDRLGSDN